MRPHQVGGWREAGRSDLSGGRTWLSDNDRRWNSRSRQCSTHDHGQRQWLRRPPCSLPRCHLSHSVQVSLAGIDTDLSTKAQIPFGSSRHVSTRSTCRAHVFWLCRACRTARLDLLVSTRVSCRDVTSQVGFGINWALCWRWSLQKW